MPTLFGSVVALRCGKLNQMLLDFNGFGYLRQLLIFFKNFIWWSSKHHNQIQILLFLDVSDHFSVSTYSRQVVQIFNSLETDLQIVRNSYEKIRDLCLGLSHCFTQTMTHFSKAVPSALLVQWECLLNDIVTFLSNHERLQFSIMIKH